MQRKREISRVSKKGRAYGHQEAPMKGAEAGEGGAGLGAGKQCWAWGMSDATSEVRQESVRKSFGWGWSADLTQVTGATSPCRKMIPGAKSRMSCRRRERPGANEQEFVSEEETVAKKGGRGRWKETGEELPRKPSPGSTWNPTLTSGCL